MLQVVSQTRFGRPHANNRHRHHLLAACNGTLVFRRSPSALNSADRWPTIPAANNTWRYWWTSSMHCPRPTTPALLAELAKYGASLTLATQILGALAAAGADQQLLHAVFGNVDHILAFNCAATDARVLAPELAGPLEPADLVELGDYHCYARWSHRGERLPAFHLRLDPPPNPDSVVRDLLAATSAACYGRPAGRSLRCVSEKPCRQFASGTACQHACCPSSGATGGRSALRHPVDCRQTRSA